MIMGYYLKTHASLKLYESQTKYIVDWLAESESQFLGHTIGITKEFEWISLLGIMWPINNVYTTVP